MAISSRNKKSLPIDGRLYTMQLQMLRGLKSRWKRLQQSRSVDTDQLNEKMNEAESRFESMKQRQTVEHETAWQEAMTRWDVSLDKQIASAERDTLLILQHEKQETRRFKQTYRQSREGQKQDFETKSLELKNKLDDTKNATTKSRDSIRGKLDHEKDNIEEQVHACREWIGLRTGNPAIATLVAQSPAQKKAEYQSINELSQIASQFEEAKKRLLDSVHRMRHHPTAQLLGSTWFLSLGPILGSLIALVAWLAQAETVVVVGIAIVGSILITAFI
jgi:hypothetical protein